MKESRFKHKKRNQKNWKLPVSIVGFVSIGCLVFGMVVSLKYVNHYMEQKETQETVQLQQELITQEGTTNINIDTVEDIKITISAAGDCTFATDINYAGGPSFVAKYNEVQDPSYFLRNVQEVFANDDLTIVNFEGTLTNLTTRQDKEFAFRGDPSYVNILTSGSVEAVNLANNHSRDYGMQSLTDTKQYLTEAGVTHFGYEETAIYEVKGVKIGLIGIYVLPDGLGRMQQLQEHIAKVKSEGAVITIVNFHWGIEREYYPNDVQKQLAHAAIDHGADLVIGEHPHVLQGIEVYNGKQIVYSMGNFCFGGNKNPSDKDSMIFQQTFTVREGKVINYDDVNVIPCSISSVSNVNNYQPTILTGEEADRVMNKINEISAPLNNH